MVFAFFTINVFSQTCNFSATFIKEDSHCESNGVVTVEVQDPSQYDNIRYGLFSKTGASYPQEFQLTNILENVPPGVYDIRVAAKCKGVGEEDKIYNVGEVEIIGTYTTPNMYLKIAEVIKSLPTFGPNSFLLRRR